MISQSALDQAIKRCIKLLGNENLWVSSNAALVLARISIEDVGCKMLLYHSENDNILKKLIDSLGNDDAGYSKRM